MKLNLVLLPAALWAAVGCALSTADWQKQSVYQVLTDRFARTDSSTTASCPVASYCGGTWRGLINKLDYIQGMGFTAVWISPIVKNIEGDTPYGTAYHGFWAQDIWSLNSNFGTEADLIALSAALHARGMYLMVDVVTNHMGYNGCGSCVDYSMYNPFSSSSYYHSFCEIDYDDDNSVRTCWEGDNVVSLPDLRTEDSSVRAVFSDWAEQIVAKYSIDGFRVDSVKHVEKDFWPPFEAASGVFNLGEVYDGNPYNMASWLEAMSGVMNYPVYYYITRAFQSTTATMAELVAGINTMKGSVKTSTLGSFMENHDQMRFPALTSDMALVKNAIAFTMLMDGIPIIYQGQEQHFSGGETPNNREALWSSGYNTNAELYTWIAALNQIHNKAVQESSYITYQAYPIWSDSHTIVLRKGVDGSQVISAYTNVGSSGSGSTVTLSSSLTGFTASQSLMEVMGCQTYTADSSGGLSFQVGTTAKVFYPVAKLSGSGICGTTTSPGTTTTATPATTLVTSTKGCATPTAVAVTFNEVVTTVVGQTIKVVGNIDALGGWDTSKAIALSASQYTESNHLWTGTISLAPGTVVQYKFINVASTGTVTWEADPNHTFTVPASCTTAATVPNTWQT